ncbi:RSP_7527 family protein [Oceanobacter mangrovi]|uniref:RSP_7527 family protein n=1 Tax=Oceanobacter mangrovi TaxID=2862510 RepID=UPI001C8DCA76|nr:hypothetical protein [Oceanobacter mangrovi]
MNNSDFHIENAADFDVEFHIQRARALRSAYVAEFFVSLGRKIAALLHIGHKDHNMASSH